MSETMRDTRMPSPMTPEEEAELLAVTADRFPGEPASEVDRVARLLMGTWERAEGTRVNPTYVATFVDMARTVLADTGMRGQREALPVETPVAFAQAVIYHRRRTSGEDGCTECGPLPVGSSLPDHVWEAYRRNARA